MTLVRWDPMRELASMEIDRLNRMFSDFFPAAPFGRAWMPAVDIYETEEGHEYVIKAELPEMRREDINITFENGVLTLRGERKAEFDETKDTYHRMERQYGSFTRSFTLPATVDPAKISANYKDGVLTVRVPQREEARPKTIEVQE
jgi:HSP20 family protein